MEAVVELDSRASGDIAVTLLWNRERNTISVRVVDLAQQEDFTIAVPAHRAADAFAHPFAYRALPYTKVKVRSFQVAQPEERA